MAVNTISIEQFKRVFSVISAEQRESFIKTSMTYNGARNSKVLNTFLTAITVYKTLDKISDEDLLKKLPNLLKEDAATWWNENNDQIQTWNEFQVGIKRQFPDKKPHEIYSEIFVRQRYDESTEEYVANRRALFAQLPEPHPENVQIDMLFGFLILHIRSKLERESFDTFDGLVTAATEIERREPPKKRRSPRCLYCRIRGHVVAECLKRKRSIEVNKIDESDEDSPIKKIYTRDVGSQIPSPYDPKSEILLQSINYT